MQFFSTVYSAVKHSRPLIHKVGVSNDVPNCILNQSFRAFSSRLDSDQEAILSNIPLKPKKPPSVYIRYVKLIEPKLVQQYPNAKRTEIVKAAAKMFKEAEKETLLDLQNSYLNDVEQYKKDVEAYTSKLTEEQKGALIQLKSIEKKNKIRKQLKQDEKAANKPKQPLNAYMLYIQKRRAEETPSTNLVEWTKKVGDEWKNLPEDEKSKYIAKAKELREKYANEKSKWEASLENTEFAHLIPTAKKPESKTKNTKSKSKSKVSEKALKSSSVGPETVYTPNRKSDSKNVETTISNDSSSNDKNFQSSPSSSGDENPKIHSELKEKTNPHLVDNELSSKLKENKLNKTVFLNNTSFPFDKVSVVIGVTFVSFFIVLPLLYFFCC